MRKKTKTIYGIDALKKLEAGVKAIAKPVALTMGAKGKNGCYLDFGSPVVTNDGISIARQIYPEDPFESIGTELALQSSEKTNIEAGDGTSGTIVINDAIIEEGIKAIESGKHPMILRQELEDAKNKIVSYVKEQAKPIDSDEELLNIAKISVEDDDIAKIVTDSVIRSGKYGSVTVEEGVSYSIETEDMKGYFWNQGFLSPYMITNPSKMEAVIDDCAVIVTDKHMNQNKDLLGLLSSMHSAGVKNFLVVADNIEGELLATFIQNKLKNIITVIAVRRPATYEELEDIAILVNGTAVTKQSGIKQIEKTHLGFAKKVIVTDKKITILTDDSPALKQRVDDLAELSKEDETVKERLSKLTDGKIIIRVGAKTEADRQYLKLKIDDAVGACRAAKEEGIVAGGGAFLRDVSNKFGDSIGILQKAIIAPYNNILNNAGIVPDGKNYNVKTGEVVKDMISAGIIDPAKVIRCEIENAVSLAKTLLTIDHLTVRIEEDQVSEK